MEITETFYAPTREAWRAWLEANHREKDEIWLISYRKAAGMPGASYNDTVEEALCFGWIDSIRKSLGEDRLAQRFTPRRADSPYSRINLERLARLLEQGKVIPEVREALGHVRPEDYVLPDDILAALRANEAAWRNFRGFSAAYQRIRVAHVDQARGQADEFRRRLERLVRMSERGKQFGYGIQSYY